MKNKSFFNQAKILILALLMLLTAIPPLFAQSAGGADGKSPGKVKSEKACVIKISGEIDNGTALYVKRALSTAKKSKCSVAIIEIDSPGGNIDSCEKIKDTIVKSPVETIAYIDGRALGESTLIVMACDRVYMSPTATFGAISKDSSQAMKASLDALVKAKAGQRHSEGDAAAADPSEIIAGLTQNSQSLAMTPDTALDMQISSGTAQSIDDFLKTESGQQPQLIEKKSTPMEILAGMVSNPVFAIIFLVIGLCGAIKEMFIPGHGAGAAIAVVFLGLFFGGKYIAGSATILTAILLITGIILLLVEVLLVPGFGVPGVLGVGCIGATIIMSFEDVNTGLAVFAAVLVLSCILMYLFFKYISKSNFVFDKFAIKPVDDGTADKIPENAETDFEMFLGKTGKAVTELRPYGKAEFGEDTIDVMAANGKYLAKGTVVKVTEVEGNKVVVEPENS